MSKSREIGIMNVISMSHQCQLNGLQCTNNACNQSQPAPPPPPVRALQDSSEKRKLTSKCLTDLKENCLELIFEWLDFADLMHVALAYPHDAHIREMATVIFCCKYRHQTFAVHADRISVHGEQTPCIAIGADPLETIGNFFKYFGKLLTKLAIFGTPNDLIEMWIDCCTSKYCTDTLTEIFFYNCKSGSTMNELSKPFLVLEGVTIIQSHLGENLSRFNVWFPKMRSLKLVDNVVTNPISIEAHFPELEALVVWLHGNTKTGFTKANLIEMIRLNPNLKELWFQFYSFSSTLDELQLDHDLCRMICVNLRHLERFVWAPDNITLPNCDRITFKKVRYFVSEGQAYQFSFKQLEELDLRRIKIPINEMIEFICRNKKLLILKISLDYLNFRQASTEHVVKMAKNLPKLTELVLDSRLFAFEDALKFLSLCKSLVKLQLMNVYDRWTQLTQMAQKHVDCSWKLVRTESDVVFKRLKN